MDKRTSHIEDVLTEPAHAVLDRTVHEQQPALQGPHVLVSQQRIQNLVLGQQTDELGQRAAAEHLQPLPRRLAHSALMQYERFYSQSDLH